MLTELEIQTARSASCATCALYKLHLLICRTTWALPTLLTAYSVLLFRWNNSILILTKCLTNVMPCGSTREALEQRTSARMCAAYSRTKRLLINYRWEATQTKIRWKRDGALVTPCSLKWTTYDTMNGWLRTWHNTVNIVALVRIEGYLVRQHRMGTHNRQRQTFYEWEVT